MLYYLFQYLEKFDFPGAGMFGYVSFRSLMAIILSLLISAIFGEYFINLLKRKQITETQREKSWCADDGRYNYYCRNSHTLPFVGEAA